MIPKVFGSSSTTFTSNGIGSLTDASSCLVSEELNGAYELEMTYPSDGRRAESLVEGNIIVAKHDDLIDWLQPFRIYNRTDTLNGRFKVLARHICYDLSKVTIFPGAPTGNVDPEGAWQYINGVNNYAGSAIVNFTFSSDIEDTAAFEVKVPSSAKSVLGGMEGSMLELYGGEFEYNRYSIMLNGRRGADNGVSIRYRKNLTGIEAVSTADDAYYAVVPFCVRGNNVIMANPKVVVLSEYSSHVDKVLPLDLTNVYNSSLTPSAADVENVAKLWLQANTPWIVEKAITASFVDLSKSDEYANLASLYKVALGDTVRVQYVEAGVDADFRVVKVVYDALRERFSDVTLGRMPDNITDAIYALVGR